MPTIYTQAPMDHTIVKNTWQTAIFTISMMLLASFAFTMGSTKALGIFTVFLVFWGLSRLNTYKSIRETQYQVEGDALTICKNWPLKNIRISLNEVRAVSLVTLDAFVYVCAATSSSRWYNPSLSKRTVIPLTLPHKLRESDVNSYNCIYVTPGILMYHAYPPTHTDIKVVSLLTNAQRAVLLEGPVNYIISPQDSEGFLEQISKIIAQEKVG
jgi:hypothetical protein